jgi:dTDP-4-dehydrorhamnose reductase
MGKSLLIFGGSGFVGAHIAIRAIRNGWKVFIADSREIHIDGIAGCFNVDIAGPDPVMNLLERIRPDAVINTAALADIDWCEKNKEQTYRVNVTGAYHLAKGTSRTGIKYVFFSSDAVFDGKSGSYKEENLPSPVNYYGWSKATAETEVLWANPDSVIVRISLVLGYPVDEGNSFIKKLEKQLKKEEPVSAPSQIIRTPIDVRTLASAVVELAGSEYRGIIHLGSLQSIDRYRLTRLIAEKMGCDPKLVIEDRKNQGSLSAPRHKRGILDVSLAQKILHTKMCDLSTTIENALIQ